MGRLVKRQDHLLSRYSRQGDVVRPNSGPLGRMGRCLVKRQSLIFKVAKKILLGLILVLRA